MKKNLLLTALFAAAAFQFPIAQNVGIGTLTPQARLDINGDIIIRSMPLLVTNGVNAAVDINTVRFSNYKITGPTANFTIAGIAAGVDGRMVTFNNKTSFTMQVTNEDVAAAAASRISTGTGAAVDINAGGSITLQYDADLSRWIVQSKNHIVPGGGGGAYWTLSGSNIYNNNAGNVGIGISNPFGKLHVKKDNEAVVIQGSVPYIAFYDNAGTYKGFVWQGPGDNVSIGTSHVNPSGALQFYNNGILNMSLTNSGVLDLTGSLPWFRFNDGSLRSGDIYGDGSNLELAAYKSGFFGTPGNLILQASDISQFQELYAGRVGIGVRDPAFKLDIGDRIRLRSGSTSETAGLWLNNPTNSALIGFVGTANANTIGLYGSSAGWGIALNTINGNVGIGTLNPTYKLSVNGNIRTKEVVVESGWADYVFDKNYRLRSLDEVELFIQQHKHLPNIPSAKEIETNGLHLGDVQKRMMEKIEELTLYVIELKKEIEVLKKEKL
jgi:hypothetical protein